MRIWRLLRVLHHRFGICSRGWSHKPGSMITRYPVLTFIKRSRGRITMPERRKRVVILGGGFAGIYTAQYLERALGTRDDFEIVLVNRENYFVFQPMLPEVISGTIGLTDMVSPIRRLLRRTELHVRVVVTSPGFRPHTHEIAYDHLVVALGNVTDFRGLPGLPEHAMPFENLGDA